MWRDESKRLTTLRVSACARCQEYVSLHDRRCKYANIDERQFKQALLDAGVLGSRLLFAASKGYPLAVTSVIPYDATSENVPNKRYAFGEWAQHMLVAHYSTPLTALRWYGTVGWAGLRTSSTAGIGCWVHIALNRRGKDGRARAMPNVCMPRGANAVRTSPVAVRCTVPVHPILTRRHAACRSRDERSAHPFPTFEYDPNHIDDPEIRENQDKQVVSMVGYRVVRAHSYSGWYPNHDPNSPAELDTICPGERLEGASQCKGSCCNASAVCVPCCGSLLARRQFREKHEWIPPELTLSKIRNLKALVLELWVRYVTETCAPPVLCIALTQPAP